MQIAPQTPQEVDEVEPEGNSKNKVAWSQAGCARGSGAAAGRLHHRLHQEMCGGEAPNQPGWQEEIAVRHCLT